MSVCDAPKVIAPSESALTRNPEVPSLRNSTDRSPEVNWRRIRYRHNGPNMSNSDRLSGGVIVEPLGGGAMVGGVGVGDGVEGLVESWNPAAILRWSIPFTAD